MRSGDSPSFRWRLIMSRVLLGSSSNSSSNSTATPQGQNFTSVETLLGPTAKRGTFNSAITFENTSAAQRMARIWVSYHAKAWVAFLPDSLRCSVVSIGSAAPRHSRRNTYARRSVCQSLYMQRAKPRNAVGRAARIRVPARLGNFSRVRGPRYLRLQGVTPGIESSHGRRSHAALRRGAVLEGGPIRALAQTPRQRACRPGFLRHCLCELAGQSGPVHSVGAVDV